MTALSAERTTLRKGEIRRKGPVPVGANVKLWRGAAVGFNADGYLVPCSNSSTIDACGVVRANFDNTGGLDGAIEASYYEGVFGFDGVGVVGDACYFTDDHTVAVSGNCYAGVVELEENGQIFVDIELDSNLAASAAANVDLSGVEADIVALDGRLDTAESTLSTLVTTVGTPTSAATNSTIVKRGASAESSHGALTATSVVCPSLTTAAGVAMTVRPTIAASGAGAAATFGSGLGASGSIGGTLSLGVGAVVSNATAPLLVDANGTTILDIRRGAGPALNIYAGPNGAANADMKLYGYAAALTANNTDVTIAGTTGCNITAPYAEFSGQASSAINSVSYSATPTLDCNLSNHHTIGVMTNNITTIDASNIRSGAIYTIRVTQDGTGSKTIGWAAKFIFGATYTNAPAAAANSITIWQFRSDGTNLRCIGKETYTS